MGRITMNPKNVLDARTQMVATGNPTAAHSGTDSLFHPVPLADWNDVPSGSMRPPFSKDAFL